MASQLSRRHWVLFMGSAPLLAQTAVPAVPSPEQRVEKAKGEVRQVSDQLALIAVPMNVEPAFRFVA
jgi:hypothetical protein